MSNCIGDNCEVKYCDIPNQLCRVNGLKQGQISALLAILQNSKFIADVSRTTKMARAYFNADKYWCQNISFNSIKGYRGKNLRLILHPTYNYCNGNNLICSYDYNRNKSRTFPCGSNLNRIITHGPQTVEESIFYYYYKNHNFFIRILTALKWAVSYHNADKYYCKVIELPNDFDWGLDKKDLKFRIRGRDIMSLYGYVYPCPNMYPNCICDTWGNHTKVCPTNIITTIQGARGNPFPTWYLPVPRHLVKNNKNQCNQKLYGLLNAIGNSKYRNVKDPIKRHEC